MNHNNADIEYDPKFDNKFSLSRGNKEPLPVVTISLRGGKKERADMVSGLTLLQDSLATNSTIQIKHTKNYQHRMRYNKVEYSTAAGLYCTTHDIKVTFFLCYIYLAER